MNTSEKEYFTPYWFIWEQAQVNNANSAFILINRLISQGFQSGSIGPGGPGGPGNPDGPDGPGGPGSPGGPGDLHGPGGQLDPGGLAG